MSIEVNDKNLGHATAYAYAKAGGYTGTEEEFEELLGNIATDLAEIENLTVTVTTLPAGSAATASYSDGVLALGIPKGDKGDTGTAATIAVGTVTTVAPTASATVTNTGTTGAAVFAFEIPRGDGVATVTKTGTSGNVDTYTMTSDRGVTLGTFTVTNSNVSSVNGETGTVVLDAGDIDYDDTETYASGSTGEALNQLKSAISKISFEKSKENLFVFSSGSIVYYTADLSASFSGDNIILSFTQTANPVICFRVPNLIPGKKYNVKFAVTQGTINEDYCYIRQYNSAFPHSGTSIEHLQFTNHAVDVEVTVPSGNRDIVLDLQLVYSSKNVTLSGVSVTASDAISGEFIKDSAENLNAIDAAFVYNSNTGDCSILKIKGDSSDKVVMIDCMPNETLAKTNIISALDYYSITHLDYFILSHWHSDHYGCLEYLHDNGYIDSDTVFYLPEDPDAESEGLVREDNPDKVVVANSQAAISSIDSWGCSKIYPGEGDVLAVNGCNFVFWNTDHSDYYAREWVDYNECSLCCTMIYGYTVMQFTGDIGPVACGKYFDKLYKCNIFKANHHACGYAIVPKFMSAVFPEIVVTMAGSNVIYSTDPSVQAVFATLTTGLQQWCEDEFVPNYVTGVVQKNIYMTLGKHNFKFDSDCRRCVRSDEGIPASS